eukprot:390548-Amphidinium_carterae.1
MLCDINQLQAVRKAVATFCSRQNLQNLALRKNANQRVDASKALETFPDLILDRLEPLSEIMLLQGLLPQLPILNSFYGT